MIRSIIKVTSLVIVVVALVWSIEGLIDILSSIPLLIAFFIIRRASSLYESHALRVMQYSWLAIGLQGTILGISLLTQNVYLYFSRLLFLGVGIVCMEYAVNLLEYDRIQPFRFGFSIFVASGLIFSALFLRNYSIIFLSNGTPSFLMNSPSYILFMIAIIWLYTTYLYFCTKLYLTSNEQNQPMALLNLQIVGVGGFIILVINVFKLQKIILASDAIILGVIALGSMFILNRNPKLFLLFPHRPIKLFVMEMESGNNIYSYDWKEDPITIPAPLFATALESIHIFVRESLNKGKLQEIKLENAIMLIQHEPGRNISYVLLAEQSSYIMKRSLENFIQLFQGEKEMYYNEDNVVMVDNLEVVNLMVEAVF